MASTNVVRPSMGEICNSALLYMGHPRVSLDSVDPVAVAIETVYNRTLPAVLSDYEWKFALKQQNLTSVTPIFTVEAYDYAYLVPGDCIKVVTVVGRGEYAIYQGYIFTNEESPIRVEYVANVQEGLFPPYFVDALTKELASRLAITLTEDVSRAKQFREDAALAWRKARHNDSKIQTTGGLGDAVTDATRTTPILRY